MAEYIKADERAPIQVVSPVSGEKAFSLQELQKCVEGYVEAIPLTPELIMCVNEDGIMLNKPRNTRATAKLWEYRPSWKGTSIWGDVLIATLVEMGEGGEED